MPNVAVEESVVPPSRTGIFTMKSTWSAIRCTYVPQNWCKVVWFHKHIPRWAFILWSAMQQKLNTRDRLLVWDVVYDASCVLCDSGSTESQSHLFFHCSYSR